MCESRSGNLVLSVSTHLTEEIQRERKNFEVKPAEVALFFLLKGCVRRERERERERERGESK